MDIFRTSMLPDAISPDEHLFRAIKDGNPNLWKGDRPTSAAFKDSKGLSVNRQGDRTIEESCNIAQNIYALTKAVVHLSNQACIELGAMPEYNAVPGNDYHTIIKDLNGDITLSTPVAKRLARACLVCYVNENPPEIVVNIPA